jgi:ribosomal peptide maturation radical SAM protein 1
MGRTQLEQFPFVDYVFSGEVDRSFPEFVRRRFRNEPVEDVPGIVYRTGRGEVALGPCAEPIQDLDRLPLPDFDDFAAARERQGIASIRELVVALESARGCWWGAKQHCTFCGLNALGMAYRQKSQDRFRWEVEEIGKRYRTRHFYITDNILSMSYFKEFVDWAGRSPTERNFFWEIKANINRHQARSLARAGINWLQPGIEHFSSEVLQIMKKGVKGIQNIAFLKYANENGLLIPYYILYGFPGETAEMYQKMERNLRKLVHLEPPRAVGAINYERFNPYHQNPEAYGFRLRPVPHYRLFYPFSEDVLSKLVYFFERDDSPKFPYVEGVKREVREWQKAYELSSARKERSSLSWTEEGGEIVIDDRRAGFPRRRYRLADHAAAVFHALDRPTTLEAAAKSAEAASSEGPRESPRPERRASPEARAPGVGPRRTDRKTGTRSKPWWTGHGSEEVISFTPEEFGREPARCLEPLVLGGILYVEDDWYLALPVARASHRPSSTIRRWHTTTVGLEAMRATPWWFVS